MGGSQELSKIDPLLRLGQNKPLMLEVRVPNMQAHGIAERGTVAIGPGREEIESRSLRIEQ